MVILMKYWKVSINSPESEKLLEAAVLWGETISMGFTSRNPSKLSQWRAKKDPLMILARVGDGKPCKIHSECSLYQRPTVQGKDN